MQYKEKYELSSGRNIDIKNCSYSLENSRNTSRDGSSTMVKLLVINEENAVHKIFLNKMTALTIDKETHEMQVSFYNSDSHSYLHNDVTRKLNNSLRSYHLSNEYQSHKPSCFVQATVEMFGSAVIGGAIGGGIFAVIGGVAGLVEGTSFDHGALLGGGIFAAIGGVAGLLYGVSCDYEWNKGFDSGARYMHEKALGILKEISE